MCILARWPVRSRQKIDPVATALAEIRHEGYRLGPNDTLRIQVYGEDDLSLETKVEGDG